MKLFSAFLRDEFGQDMIEYGLLISFLAIASAIMFLNVGQSIKGIWSIWGPAVPPPEPQAPAQF